MIHKVHHKRRVIKAVMFMMHEQAMFPVRLCEWRTEKEQTQNLEERYWLADVAQTALHSMRPVKIYCTFAAQVREGWQEDLLGYSVKGHRQQTNKSLSFCYGDIMWSTCECDKRLEIIKVGSGSFEPKCSHIRPRLEQDKTFKIHDYRVCMIRDETKHCRTVAFQNVPGSVLQAIWNSYPFLFSFSLKLMLMVSYKTRRRVWH